MDLPNMHEHTEMFDPTCRWLNFLEVSCHSPEQIPEDVVSLLQTRYVSLVVHERILSITVAG